jgi:hypothetical protein
MSDHPSVKRLLLPGLLVLVGFAGGSAAAVSRTVPPGFQPFSFTAVSEHDFWLLGGVPCAQGRCTAIVRTTDGGKSFTAIDTPIVPTSGITPELRFATKRDGFLFVRWRGLFFETHDGGATWTRDVLGPVLAFASAGGTRYVATRHLLAYAPVSAKRWRSRPFPFPTDGSPLDLEAHSSNVWLLGTRRANAARDLVARSSDGGRTFHTRQGPCTPGLGGALAPVSASVVWAVCSTGMLGTAWRSTNGGISFAHLRTPQLVNSAQIAAASARIAVLARGGNARLLRTTDGGKTWRAARTPGRFSNVIFLGFTDARVGAALGQLRSLACKQQNGPGEGRFARGIRGRWFA